MADLANKVVSQREQASEHPLDQVDEARASDNSGAPEAQADASWEHLPAEQRYTAKANVNVYLDDFI